MIMLKPCPFCGGQVRLMSHTYTCNTYDGYPKLDNLRVGCAGCNCEIKIELTDRYDPNHPKDVVEVWNSRHIDLEEYDKLCGETSAQLQRATEELKQAFIEEWIDMLHKIKEKL